MHATAAPSLLRRIVELVAVAVLYYAAARLGLLVAFGKTNASPVWPPSGIAFASLLILGYRVWPGVFAGAVLANILVFRANQAAAFESIVAVSIIIGIGNTLEAVIGRWLLRRVVTADYPFDRTRDVLRFVGVVLVMCIVSASIGPSAVALIQHFSTAEFWQVCFVWWLGDAAGVLVVTPLILSWTRQPAIRWDGRWVAELVGLFAALVVVSQLIFGDWFDARGTDIPPGFVLFPLLAWAAFRFGPREASTGIVMFVSIAVWWTVHGCGPFVRETVNGSLMTSSAYVATVAATSLVMSATASVRRRTEEELRRAHGELESRVQERTAEIVAANRALELEVTERRRLELQFRGMLEATPDAMVIVDQAGNIVLVNSQTETLFGYPRHEIVGQPVELLIPERYREQHRRHRSSYSAEPRMRPMGVGLDLFGLRKDGAEFPVEVSLGPVETEAGLLVSSTIRDITQRRLHEQQIRKSERQLREAQQITRLGSWEWEVASNEVRWSDELYRIYGLDRQQFAATFEGFLNRVHPDDRTQTKRFIELAFQSGRPFEFFERIVRPDGSIRVLQSRGEVELDANGNPVRLFGTCQDVTEANEMEDKLRQSERLATIGQMAAGLAHDSRNALQQIQISVDRLRRRLKETPDAPLVEEIQQAHTRLLRLLEDVRSYAAPVKLDRSVVDLGDIWREAWRLLAPFRANRAARLHEQTNGLDLTCSVDKICLERVFHNILLNSLAACGEPAVIEIHCTGSAISGQRALCVAVRDNGPGLNHEQQQRIFQPFFTTKTQGTGLGMSITKRIVEAHGGYIEAGRSVVGGAEIVLTLPTGTS